MSYTLYNPTTGQILGIMNASESVAKIKLRGQSYLPGRWDSNKYYVPQGKITLLPEKPSQIPWLQYNFDWATHSWVLDLDASKKLIRARRNNFMLAVDRVNPIWYDSLTTEQQQALATYRQALLDIPQQADFPQSVEWPDKPTWLPG